MFLFAPQPSPSNPQVEIPLARPIAQAAEQTGVPFDYLVKTAQRESGMNPEAKALNSTASGLFQFIEQTWFGLMKRQGGNLGLDGAAAAISQERSGRYVVSDPSARQQILELRKDPTLSSKMAGIFTAENRDSLRNALRREPTRGELYIAHFMGAGGAHDFIAQAASQPDKEAAASFPEAAAANRSIFFDAKGRGRSLREVYARLVSHHEAEGEPAATAPAPAEAGEGTRSPLALAAGEAQSQNAFTALFRSAGTGEGAQAMRKAWEGVAQSRFNAQAPSFFPRGDGPPAARLAALEMPPGAAEPGAEGERPRYPAVDLPLPPLRPQKPGVLAAAPQDLTAPARKRGASPSFKNTR